MQPKLGSCCRDVGAHDTHPYASIAAPISKSFSHGRPILTLAFTQPVGQGIRNKSNYWYRSSYFPSHPDQTWCYIPTSRVAFTDPQIQFHATEHLEVIIYCLFEL